jgi:phosphatidylglycerol:prolipoprotein diacylglycerol transferase
MGVFVTLLYCFRRRLPFWSLADAAAIAVLAGEIVGRFGCTLNGDVHGIPTGGNWGFVYLHPDALVPFTLRGVPLYPIPLMYQAWLLGTALVLALLHRRQATPGKTFLVYLIAYALGRAVISLWLLESKPGTILNSTQIVSLAVVALALVLLLRLRAARASS